MAPTAAPTAPLSSREEEKYLLRRTSAGFAGNDAVPLEAAMRPLGVLRTAQDVVTPDRHPLPERIITTGE